jgi:hypothetical protein
MWYGSCSLSWYSEVASLSGSFWRKSIMKSTIISVALLLAVAGITVPSQANGKLFNAKQVYNQSESVSDRMLGRPRNVGKDNKFREYEIENAGVFVGFKQTKATQIVVTSRIPFSSPVDAAASIGVNLRNRQPSSKSITQWVWKNVDNIPVVVVRSFDGRLWEVIELGDSVQDN